MKTAVSIVYKFLLYETRDKIQDTRGRSACGAHFSPELLESLVSLFVVGLRPMWVNQKNLIIFSSRQTDEDAGGKSPGPRLFPH
jgi:hypothetical protein